MFLVLKDYEFKSLIETGILETATLGVELSGERYAVLTKNPEDASVNPVVLIKEVCGSAVTSIDLEEVTKCQQEFISGIISGDNGAVIVQVDADKKHITLREDASQFLELMDINSEEDLEELNSIISFDDFEQDDTVYAVVDKVASADIKAITIHDSKEDEVKALLEEKGPAQSMVIYKAY